MSYDPECSTYWCDACGKMMEMHPESCTEQKLVLRCSGGMGSKGGCGHTRSFEKVEEDAWSGY